MYLKLYEGIPNPLFRFKREFRPGEPVDVSDLAPERVDYLKAIGLIECDAEGGAEKQETLSAVDPPPTPPTVEQTDDKPKRKYRRKKKSS